MKTTWKKSSSKLDQIYQRCRNKSNTNFVVFVSWQKLYYLKTYQPTKQSLYHFYAATNMIFNVSVLTLQVDPEDK